MNKLDWKEWSLLIFNYHDHMVKMLYVCCISYKGGAEARGPAPRDRGEAPEPAALPGKADERLRREPEPQPESPQPLHRHHDPKSAFEEETRAPYPGADLDALAQAFHEPRQRFRLGRARFAPEEAHDKTGAARNYSQVSDTRKTLTLGSLIFMHLTLG